MADNSILAAYLASRQLAGGQRDTRDTALQRYASALMSQGSDTSPVRSWGEGLARALQGGLGGLVSAYSAKTQADTESGNQKALAEYLSTGNVGALSGVKGELGNTINAQLASQKFEADRRAAGLKAGADSFGVNYGAPPAASPTPGQPTPLAPLPGGQVAPGGFANNTGNIRASNVNWEGKGAPLNGFETFNTPQDGVNAHFKNFQAYAQANPNMTVAQAIAKWSPSSENNTQSIISEIAERTGINPGMPLAEVLKDPAMAAQLLDAQTRREKGGIPPGVTADTFMAATGGQPAPGSVPPGSIAQPPMQMAQAQGDATAPPAAAPGLAPPGVPDVPRPQATQQQLQQYQRRIMSGEFGANRDEALAKARTALDADLDRQWQVDRERRFKEFDQQQGDYRARRDQQIKQPGETTQNESHAREQFNNLQTVKDYRKSQAVFQSAVKAANTNSAAADLNLVYAFATMMDPGSVVREGEMGMVKATQNASDQVKSMVAAVTGGQRIAPEARQALVDQMHVRYESLKGQHDELANAYGGIAERSGMKRDNVVVPIPEVKWTRSAGNQRGGTTSEIVYGLDGKPVK